MSTSASVWPIGFLRGLFDRIGLGLRIESLDRMLARARRMNAQLKSTVEQLLANNRAMGEEIARLDKENGDFRLLIEKYEQAERKVDPNAKCPSCGHCHGKISTVVKEGVVRPMNECLECGFTFLSSPPIAGAELAAQLYQAPQEKL